jgi:NAD(P)-dependent dehydrogenase (short-subunit alcohol dehydrogenase family)
VDKADLAGAPAAFEHALVSHVITAKHAAPLMAEQKGGLMVQVTEGDYLLTGGNVVSELVKSGLKVLALRLADELSPRGITSVAITPGFLRSEAMLEHFGVTETSWRDGIAKDEHFLYSESPLFVGRAVAALAADDAVARHDGLLLSSWEVAREYSLMDVEGHRPDWGEHLRDAIMPAPEFAEVRRSAERNELWLNHLARRVGQYLRA